MSDVAQDVTFTVRSLRKAPGFAVVAVLTLAIGIGANTAMFTVINGALLKPLPYPNPHRVAYVVFERESGSVSSTSTPIQFSYLEENASIFEGVTTYRPFSAIIGGGPDGYWVDGMRISPGFFDVVGMRPDLGRAFTGEEMEPGGPRVLVLSHELWRTQFGSDHSIVGRAVRVGEELHTVVGVMPVDFRFVGGEGNSDVLVPLQLDPDPDDLGQNYTVLARLREGLTPTQVNTDLARVLSSLRDHYPDHAAGRARIRLMEYQEIFIGDLRVTLRVLIGATLLVLLIASANVANLLLARATGRKREMAMRVALGAGSGRIARQLVTESLVLSALGAAVGVLIGMWSLEALLAATPQAVPRVDDMVLDGRVLGFAVCLAAVTALFFGLASTLTTWRVDLAGAIKGVSRDGGGDRPFARIRNSLIVSESAISLTLLIGAGLLLASFVQLRRVDPGFNAANLLTAEIRRTPDAYRDPAQRLRFQQEALELIRTIPGVTAAAGVSHLLLADQFNLPVTVAGRPDVYETAMQIRVITDGYFATVQTPLLRGRDFSGADITGPPVAIINESTASHYWPDGGALGQRILVGQFGVRSMSGFEVVPREIVGIVADTRALSLDQRPERMIFVAPTTNLTGGISAFVIRSPHPAGVRTAVTRAIKASDPALTEVELRTMTQVVSASVARESFAFLMMALFAGVAIVLTSLGIYGVVSFTVKQRIREIGIRLALGAERRDVLRIIVRQGMQPVLIGLSIGLFAAFGLSRVLATMLYGVMPGDPVIYMCVALLMAAVALLATYVPARRAMRVDPVVALRAD